MGDDARGDQARRGRHADDAALGPADLRDRVDRGGAQARRRQRRGRAEVRRGAGRLPAHRAWATAEGWHDLRATHTRPSGRRSSTRHRSRRDPLLLYFTSGTTSRPKLVEHTQVSYPVGHLSTMYWIGLRPGDVHLNISSPGWAKHAWSCFFAPWIAEATIFVYNYARFDAAALLDAAPRGPG